jgi:hypothetical protein
MQTSVNAASESLDLVAYVGVEDGKLALGRFAKSDAAREAIDSDRLRADQRRKSAADESKPELQLESTVLALAKAEPEPGVVPFGFDARDAVAVAMDRNRPERAFNREIAPRNRQASAEEQAHGGGCETLRQIVVLHLVRQPARDG